MKKKDVDILISLLEIDSKQITISQLSKETNIDYKTVHDIVKRLEKENLIFLEKFGKAYNIILNKKNHYCLFEAEFKRRENLIKNLDFKVLYNKLNSLNFPFISLIFGSNAKKEAVKGSDIDILVICEKNRENDFESIFSLLPLDIHFTTLNFEEFRDMAMSKEFTVVSEAMKNNIILVGIEDYYRMLNNVR